jgi:hypothetical protein
MRTSSTDIWHQHFAPIHESHFSVHIAVGPEAQYTSCIVLSPKAYRKKAAAIPALICLEDKITALSYAAIRSNRPSPYEALHHLMKFYYGIARHGEEYIVQHDKLGKIRDRNDFDKLSILHLQGPMPI